MNWTTIRRIDRWVGVPLQLLSAVPARAARHARGRRSGSVERIVLVKFWGVGNLFLLLPAAAALAEAHPGARLELLTLEENRAAAVALGRFDAVETVDARSPATLLASASRAVASLRARRPDLVVDFEPFARFSGLIAAQLGARRTVGFRTPGQWRHALYDEAVPYREDGHIARVFLALAVKSGAAPGPWRPALPAAVAQAARARGRALVSERLRPGGGPVVLLHPGTSDNCPERRWPAERFGALAARLGAAGARVAFTGVARERRLVAVARAAARDAAVADLAGSLAFAELLALVSAADLVVCADTALVHVASAAGVPVLGLYGPNTPALYGPSGAEGVALTKRLDCSPCITNLNEKLHRCAHPAGRGACMAAISLDEVRAAAERLLERPRSAGGAV